MSILNRFKDIMSANINALLDKCEDPAKMIDQYLRQLKEDLAEVKQETAAVMAEEKRTKRLVDDNAAEIAKYTDLAKKASPKTQLKKSRKNTTKILPSMTNWQK